MNLELMMCFINFQNTMIWPFTHMVMLAMHAGRVFAFQGEVFGDEF